ncbi:hypothetical protein SLS58_002151 [Diplodia intermedia]|uniref:Uncharacterized protein n=1 Tax=Diplodia intermedia TaxID=856260 RepID=A0ABR3U0S4_9PEZI
MPTPPTVPAATTSTATAPTTTPFATSTQYPPTLSGTRLYLRDVHALTVLLTPPIPPGASATIARFIRLVSTGANGRTDASARGRNRFYVLALGHFPLLRRLLIGASIGAGGSGDGETKAADRTTTMLVLPPPTVLQERLLCMYAAWRAEMGVGGVVPTPGKTPGTSSLRGDQLVKKREEVRDWLLCALEVLRRYAGKERDGQGGGGTGPGSWGEVRQAAEVLGGLKNDPRGPHWALAVHARFLKVDNWDDGESVARKQSQPATGSLLGDITDVMQGVETNGTKGV